MKNEPERLEALIGRRVRELREERGWSQTELAHKLRGYADANWQQSTVAKVEAATRPIRFDEGEVLAAAFGVAVTDLMSPAGPEELTLRQELAHVRRQRARVEQQRSMFEAQMRVWTDEEARLRQREDELLAQIGDARDERGRG